MGLKVFLDSNLFIYLFEDYGRLSEISLALVGRVLARRDTLVTSTMTLGEMLVHPAAAGDDLDYMESRVTTLAEIADFDRLAARHFARIRADRSIKPPDAIQLACAAAAGAGVFVTNDARLSRKTIPGLDVISSLEAVPI